MIWFNSWLLIKLYSLFFQDKEMEIPSIDSNNGENEDVSSSASSLIEKFWCIMII